MTVTFASRLSATAVPLKYVWEHSVGSSRALLALHADWQVQLQRCHDELGFRHVRFHALLTDDIGTLISCQERLLYSFFNADRIWDFLLSIGMRPFVELGFMPEMLASSHETVFHFRGSVNPPVDHANPCRRWREMSEPKYLILASGAARGDLPSGKGVARLCVQEPHGALRRRPPPGRGRGHHIGARTRAFRSRL